MWYIFTIIISIILWIWFFYIKSTRECYGEPLKAPVWFYIIGFICLFIPLLNFGFPFAFTLYMIFNEDVELKNGEISIGEKIKNILNKRF